MQITFERGDPVDRPTLERLAGGGYQFVIILTPRTHPTFSSPMRLRWCLCSILRDIAGRTGQTFSIVSEILDVRNRDLAEVTSADDVIIGERLVALAMARTSRRTRM